MEEKFFFLYHMHQPVNVTMKMPINERKWLIERFLVQKNREKEAIENASKGK